MPNRNSVLTPLFTVVAVISLTFSGLFIGRAKISLINIDGQVSFHPNIETAGVIVSGANLPETAEMVYRRSGDTEWQPGHRLLRIDDGRLIGSLFDLAPATTYEVQVRAETAEMSGSFTTQVDELSFTPASIVHVDDNAAAGGDGSAAAPLRTIQEGVNRAGPGAQVLVADGI